MIERKMLQGITACSIFYNFSSLKNLLQESNTNIKLFINFLRTYAGARPKAPKRLYLLGIQMVSKYGFDLTNIIQEMGNYSGSVEKSYNIFETNFNGKNAFQIWDTVYQSIHNKNLQEAFFSLVQLNGVSGKISAFFLRDVAAALYDLDKPWKYPSNINESQLLYVQPIDIWVRAITKTLKTINPCKNEKPSHYNKFVNYLSERWSDLDCILWVNSKCKNYGINPICYNQGAWFLGSQITGDETYLRRVALHNSKCLINTVKNSKAYLGRNLYAKFINILNET